MNFNIHQVILSHQIHSLSNVKSSNYTRAAAADRPMAWAPRIVPIVLAAGQSRRMGPQNKMTAPIDGVPMVRRTVENLAAALPVTPVVVSGHDPAALSAALAGLDVKIVHNPRFAEGMSTSLIAGIGALEDDDDGGEDSDREYLPRRP